VNISILCNQKRYGGDDQPSVTRNRRRTPSRIPVCAVASGPFIMSRTNLDGLALTVPIHCKQRTVARSLALVNIEHRKSRSAKTFITSSSTY
jgi:hypothetical protein